MASWDTPAVAAPTTANYAPPVQDFSSITNLLQDFVKGRQMGREEDKAALFRNGIPRQGGGETGPIDFDKTLDRAARVGGLEYAMPLLTLQQNAQNGQAGAGSIERADSMASGRSAPVASGPAPSPRAVTPTQSGPRPAAAPQEAAPPTTVMTILAAQGIPNNQLQAASESVARQLGVGPTDVIDTRDPQVANVLGPAIGFLKKNRIGEVVEPAAGASPAGVGAPATPAQRVEAGAVAAPAMDTTKADNLDKATAYLRGEAARSAQVNPKLAETLNKRADDFQVQAKAIRDAALTAAQPTPNRKDYEYAVSKGFKGSPDEWAAQAEADKAGSGERAKSDVKEANEIISSGRAAQSRLSTLNTLSNIISSDPGLTLGFGAETALKAKMALKQMGVDVGDLSGAQAIQKLNATLAAESAKTISPRPAQFEFKTFLGNNPGLSLDKAGNQRVIGIFSQLAKRDVDLGRLARQTRDNWDSWDNVVQQYDAKNPIFDPVTRQPITTDSIVAPGAPKAAAPAGAAQDGATALNPKTGERLILKGGKWVPLA